MARYTNIRIKSNRKPDGIRGDRYYTSPKYPQIPLSINDKILTLSINGTGKKRFMHTNKTQKRLTDLTY